MSFPVSDEERGAPRVDGCGVATLATVATLGIVDDVIHCSEKEKLENNHNQVKAERVSGQNPAAFILAALDMTDPGKPPCAGLQPKIWRDLRARAIEFLKARESEAVALGWDEVSLLGVHPLVGMNRVDYCGALLLGEAPVALMSADTITYRNGLKFHRSTAPCDAVPIWCHDAGTRGRRSSVMKRRTNKATYHV